MVNENLVCAFLARGVKVERWRAGYSPLFPGEALRLEFADGSALVIELHDADAPRGLGEGIPESAAGFLYALLWRAVYGLAPSESG